MLMIDRMGEGTEFSRNRKLVRILVGTISCEFSSVCRRLLERTATCVYISHNPVHFTQAWISYLPVQLTLRGLCACPNRRHTALKVGTRNAIRCYIAYGTWFENVDATCTACVY